MVKVDSSSSYRAWLILFGFFFASPGKTEPSPASGELFDSLRPAESSGPVKVEEGLEPKLLPEIMGPMEKVFWGKDGFIRGFGFPLDKAGRDREAKIRRRMLTWHQIGGFTTLAAMTATVITGQLLLNSQPTSDHTGHPGAPEPEHDHGIHGVKSALAWTTVGLYSATAILGILTPPPLERRPQWNSISWHKALAIGHFTGMFVAPLIILTVDDSDDARLYHQISGYTTLALLTGAMIVVTF